MPRTKEQNEQIRNEKIKVIINYGLQEYHKNGVRGFEMQEVAKSAGIGKGTLYHYFPSKSALLKAIFRKLLEDGIHISKTYLLGEKNAIDRITDYMHYLIEYTINNPEFVRFYKNALDDLNLIYSSDQVTSFMNEMDTDIGKPLLQAIEEAVLDEEFVEIPSWKIRQMLWWTLMGATSFYSSNDTNETIEKIIEDIMYMLFMGIRKK